MKRKITALTSGVIIGGLLLTGGMVFAAGKDAGAAKMGGPRMERFGGPGQQHGGFGRMGGQRPGGGFGDNSQFVSNLVKDGVIAQDVADKINAYTKQKQEDKQKEMDAKQQEAVKSKWDALVASGTVTQEEADKIIAFQQEKDAARKAEMDKMKSMTAEERKAFFESKKTDASADKEVKPEKRTPYKELVDAGIITQEKADAIIAAEAAQREAAAKDMQAKMKEQMKTKLDAVVTSGVITQDQEDQILAYIAEKEEARKAEMEKFKSMTAEERKASFESKKDSQDVKAKRVDMYAELVEKGVLTQEQVDAIKEATRPQGHRGGDKAPQPVEEPAAQE